MAVLCAPNFRWIFFAALSAPSPIATKRNARVQQLACVFQHHSSLLLQRIYCRCTIFKAAYPYAAVLHSLYCLYSTKNKGNNLRYMYLLWCRKLFVFHYCMLMHKGHGKKHSFPLSHTQNQHNKGVAT